MIVRPRGSGTAGTERRQRSPAARTHIPKVALLEKRSPTPTDFSDRLTSMAPAGVLPPGSNVAGCLPGFWVRNWAWLWVRNGLTIPGPNPPPLSRGRGPPAITVLAEVKRASPSEGDIAAALDVPAVAAQYVAGGAAALSAPRPRHPTLGAGAPLAAQTAVGTKVDLFHCETKFRKIGVEGGFRIEAGVGDHNDLGMVALPLDLFEGRRPGDVICAFPRAINRRLGFEAKIKRFFMCPRLVENPLPSLAQPSRRMCDAPTTFSNFQWILRSVPWAPGAAPVLTEPVWFRGSLADLEAARGVAEHATDPAARPAIAGPQRDMRPAKVVSLGVYYVTEVPAPFTQLFPEPMLHDSPGPKFPRMERDIL